MSEKDTCGCGCGHDHEHDHENEGLELETIFLTFEGEDGNDDEVECGVLGTFPVDGQDYIALVVPGEDEDSEEEFYIYKYSEDEDGEPILDVIESEEEFDKVNDVFEKEFFEDEE